MTTRVSFVADLHLFTRRSDATRHLDAINSAAARSTDLVLGGDIFDFEWSTLESTDHTVDAALEWLTDLAAEHPTCHIHYLLGNHDYCRPFLTRLEQQAAMMPNFTYHPFYLRMGDHLFLHGDAAGKQMTTEKLVKFRSKWLHVKPAGKIRRRAYDMVFRMRLHQPLPYLVHPKRRVAQRIYDYLEHVGQGPQSGVRHVFFGHIHRHLAAYRYRGITFHNGGAPLRGHKFRVLEAVIAKGR